ncbi:MBL fold metallo-hydrolase [Patescibacteria group bacterium]|nr:MBL fold metallo-hydrolase [Patescibacteria group bacterium]
MIITYYGISCFKVQSGETVLAFDPPSKESSFKSPRFQANAVLITNNHKDHNGWENLSSKIEDKDLIVLDGPGEYELEGIYIKGIQSAGQNTIYSLNFEGITLCHMGNFSEKELRPEIKEAIGEIDILLAPIDGDGVLDAQEAAKISSRLEPSIVIPMHYKDNKSLKNFLDEFGNGTTKPSDKLTIKKKDLIAGKIQVVVLEPTI